MFRILFQALSEGELTRYARLSSNPFYYEATKKLFYGRLVKRGYSWLYLNRIFLNHRWSIRTEPRDRPTTILLPFVIPYTKRKNLHILESFFKDMKLAFQDHVKNSSLQLVYSKTRNTQAITTTSDLLPSQKRILSETLKKRRHSANPPPQKKTRFETETESPTFASNSMQKPLDSA